MDAVTRLGAGGMAGERALDSDRAGAPAHEDSMRLLSGELDRACFLAWRVLNDWAMAQDAVHEACVRFAACPPAGLEAGVLRGRFMRAVHGSAVNLLRSERARRAREEAYAMNAGKERARPGESAAALETARAARAELTRLPRELRVAVCLCCEEGFSEREAARILDLPRSTVSDRVRRGLERLRRSLAGAGFAALGAAALSVEGLGEALRSLALPPAPARVAGALRHVTPVGRAVSAAAGKGGLAMKVVMGLVLAGTVAAGVAASLPGSAGGGADVPVGKALYAEHFAFIRMHVPEGIGGPAKQAGRGGWGFCATDKKGNFYLGDPQNCQVHWVDPEGVDRVIAGDGKKGYRDGPGDRARFDFGCGSYNDLALDCDDAGNVYIADGMNNRLRKISRREDGTWLVTTISGGGDKRVAKGEWVAATDLRFGCATRFAVSDDGKAAYYGTYGGVHKVLVEENKATVLISADELKAQKISYVSWHVGGAHITSDKVYYWMPGGSTIFRFDEKTGKVERFAGCGKGTRKDATDRLTAGFHTVHAIYSPNASVVYTGGGDEFACRRIYRDKVMHLLKDGSWRQQDNQKDAWPYGSLMALDSEGRLYTIPAPYSWPGWIVRMTFAKE